MPPDLPPAAQPRDSDPPLFDPRRGDVEDDATNTRKKSLVNLASRVLTEISLAKFLVSLAMTVVMPAMAIGLAPLIVTVWYVFFADAGHAVAGFFGFLAISLLVIMTTVGWRGFLQILEQNFWALNAVAVQPAYLIIREALRVLMEKWTDTAPDRLRAGTALLAGLLLSLSGMMIAHQAWPSSRWSFAVWELAYVPGLVKPALWNALVIIGAYLSVAVLFWAVADAWTDQATSSLQFSAAPATARPVRIAHLSDVHVVGERFGFRIESGRMGPQGNGRFARAMLKLEEMHAVRPFDIILISGDMTDAGLATEWAEFFEIVDRHPALKRIMILLPGNHDLNIVDRANPARLDLPLSVGKRMRQLRCLSALADVQGARVRVPGEDGLFSRSLDQQLLPLRPAIAAFADRGGLRRSLALTPVWDSCFPMMIPPAHDTGVGLVILNSNAEAHFSFTNALGLVPDRQISLILKAMERFPGASWVIALHHHLVEYPKRHAAFAERVGTAVINSPWFLRRLRAVAHRCVVMHGHRHIDWTGLCGALKIISAPSPVMEVLDDDETGFYVHSLWTGADGDSQVGEPEWVVLEGDTPLAAMVIGRS